MVVVVQSLSCVQFFAASWTAACQASLSSCYIKKKNNWHFRDGSVVKNLPANAEDAGNTGFIPGLEDPLEKEMAPTHSSVLAWEIPWTEEPGGLHSMGPQRVGHD